jgi:hypothetical protein
MGSYDSMAFLWVDCLFVIRLAWLSFFFLSFLVHELELKKCWLGNLKFQFKSLLLRA